MPETTIHPYASHAPVFTVDGEVKGELARDTLRVDIEEDVGGLRTFVGRFAAVGPTSDGSTGGLSYLDGAIVDFGKELGVRLGPPDGEQPVFIGRVSAIELSIEEGTPPVVSVYAEDALMDLRMTRRCRTYRDVTDADIATALAGEHGLRPDVAADGPTYGLVQQWNQSDLAFLRERAALVQAEVWVADGALCCKTRDQRGGPAITLVQGNQLVAADLRADLAHQRSALVVSGYDVDRREGFTEEAGESAVLAETTGGRTGVALLSQALGERRDARVREAATSSTEAQAWAAAELRRRARGFATVWGTTSGTSDLVVGSRLTLERVGTPFEGDGWYATAVHHTFDLSVGYRTRFRAERPTVSA